MEWNKLFAEVENRKDEQQASKMENYMKNQVSFLGIPKPDLKKLMQPYLKEARRFPLDWDFIMQCWEKPYREAQYIATDYILQHKKDLTDADLDRFHHLITHRSWWDTVDNLDAAIGEIVLRNPAHKETMLAWAVSENIWLRRTAIDYQQEYKEETDTEMLEKIICLNLNSNEFFINKAIGWSLRDYSKVTPDWVRNFLEKHKEGLAPLSVKEASKYL